MNEKYVVYVDVNLNNYYMAFNPKSDTYYWLNENGYLGNESQVVHFDNIDKAKDAIIQLLNNPLYKNPYRGENIYIRKVKYVVEFEDILYY